MEHPNAAAVDGVTRLPSSRCSSSATPAPLSHGQEGGQGRDAMTLNQHEYCYVTTTDNPIVSS
jgi:hypothetical protein